MNLRKLAQGQDCMARLPEICNFNPETTVLAHLRFAHVAGVGQKPPDTCAIFSCSACHDEIDRRTRRIPLTELKAHLLDALVRQLAWYDKHEILISVRAA
jgi:hypothetical protein